MSSRCEIRLAGSGGQGVILATVILAEAAFMAKKAVVQSQSYGPEARGGMCKGEVIVDEKPIRYTKVEHASFLLALTQESLDKYASDVSDNAIIMIDSALKAPDNVKNHAIISVPILQTAAEAVGRIATANIVAVAAINSVLKIAPDDILEQAVLMHIPKGTEKLNMIALAEGKKLVTLKKKAQGQGVFVSVYFGPKRRHGFE